MVTEAKKATNKSWDDKNMAYQTIKIRRELLEEFKSACARNGDKVNTVLREAIENYVKASE